MRRPSRPWCARHATAGLAALALAAGAAWPAAPQRSSPAPRDPPYVAGEILVKFRPETPSRAPVRAEVAGVVQRRFASGAELWRLGGGVAVPEALKRLAGDPGIEYAEPNYLVHTAKTPDDP